MYIAGLPADKPIMHLVVQVYGQWQKTNCGVTVSYRTTNCTLPLRHARLFAQPCSTCWKDGLS